jgi:D-xylose transport system permease protein
MGERVSEALHLRPGAPPASSEALRPSLIRLATALSGKWRTTSILFALAIVWVYFDSRNSVFLSYRNLSFLSVQIVVTAMIGLALVFVLILGEIDLAVVGTAAVASTVGANLAVYDGASVVTALLATLASGAAVGLAQGLIVITTRAPSFIVSLGTSLVLAGALLYLLPPTGLVSLVNQPLADLTITFLPNWLGFVLAAAGTATVFLLQTHAYVEKRGHGLTASLFKEVGLTTAITALCSVGVVVVLNGYRGVPMPLAILLIMLVTFSYLTKQTTFGLHLYAIGTNAEAARRAGIAVSRVRLAAFVLTGMVGAFGGVIAAGRILAVSTESANPTLLLEAIAATVIGGVSLFGGRGSVWSPLVGALVIGSISNGMLLLDASTEGRLVLQGAILIIAVATDTLISRWSEPGSR